MASPFELRTHTVLLLTLVGCGTGAGEGGPEPLPDPGATLTEGGVIACADASARSLVPFDRKISPSPQNSEIWLWGGGLVVTDLDGDGNHDVVLPHETEAGMVYLGTGGDTFAERPDLVAAFDMSLGTGGSSADYDGDGDLDLYITRYDAPNLLLRNDGNNVLTDVTLSAGVSGCETASFTCYKSMSSTWADYDRDGDLDLFVGNYGWVDHSGAPASSFGPAEPSFLYVNNGDGTFTDVTPTQMAMPSVHDGYTYVSTFLDLNNDLWPELYLINDFGTAYPNALVWNNAGTLTLDVNQHGMDVPMTGMGLGVGDINGDLYPDLLIPEWNSIRLLESFDLDGDVIWLDTLAGDRGLVPNKPQKVAWGGEFADMDLDGDLDALVAYGFVTSSNPVWDNAFRQPDALYVQEAGGLFIDRGAEWGIADDGVGRGFAVADFNNDGYLDLAKRDLGGPEILYMSNCGDGNWLRVNLRQPGTMNTHAVGAVIDVTVNGTTQRRWMLAGGLNYDTSPPLEAHFGLGSAATVDELVVTWPDGGKSAFQNVTGRQILTITRD